VPVGPADTPSAVRTGAANHGCRIGFHTFGCKLNQFETEALASSLRASGHVVVNAREDAEVYLMNTCTITARADHKARALVRSLARAHPESLLVVTGCSAELERQALGGLGPNVVVIPQSRKAVLLDLPRVLAAEQGAAGRARVLERGARAAASDPFALKTEEQSFRTRPALKIQDGCNGRCAYCRVPLARGEAVSLAPDEVVRRAVDLETRGNREVILTGVNLSAYGSGGVGLARLLSLLLEAAPRIRFRMSSIEPEALTEEMAAVLSHPRICPHFHLSLQSGADSVLLRMGRRYRSDTTRRAVTLLRSLREDPFLAADVIVGFPGETAGEYAATLDLVGELNFAAVHVFPFSPRPGTSAAGMRPVVPERVRSERAAEMALLAAGRSASYARGWIGREIEVLFERTGRWGTRSLSDNYLRIDVEGTPDGTQALGRLGRAIMTAAGRGRFVAFCP